jgi:hypothetical protein
LKMSFEGKAVIDQTSYFSFIFPANTAISLIISLPRIKYDSPPLHLFYLLLYIWARNEKTMILGSKRSGV